MLTSATERREPRIIPNSNRDPKNNPGKPVAFKTSWGTVVYSHELPEATHRLSLLKLVIVLEALQCGFLEMAIASRLYRIPPKEFTALARRYQRGGMPALYFRVSVGRPQHLVSPWDTQGEVPEYFEREGFELFRSERRLVYQGQAAILPGKQFHMLFLLLSQKKGESVPIMQFEKAVWNGYPPPREGTIKVYIVSLNKIVRRLSGKKLIISTGGGYVFQSV